MRSLTGRTPIGLSRTVLLIALFGLLCAATGCPTNPDTPVDDDDTGDDDTGDDDTGDDDTGDDVLDETACEAIVNVNYGGGNHGQWLPLNNGTNGYGCWLQGRNSWHHDAIDTSCDVACQDHGLVCERSQDWNDDASCTNAYACMFPDYQDVPCEAPLNDGVAPHATGAGSGLLAIEPRTAGSSSDCAAITTLSDERRFCVCQLPAT